MAAIPTDPPSVAATEMPIRRERVAAAGVAAAVAAVILLLLRSLHWRSHLLSSTPPAGYVVAQLGYLSSGFRSLARGPLVFVALLGAVVTAAAALITWKSQHPVALRILKAAKLITIAAGGLYLALLAWGCLRYFLVGTYRPWSFGNLIDASWLPILLAAALGVLALPLRDRAPRETAPSRVAVAENTAVASTNGLAVAALTCGILGLVACVPAAVLAVIFGHISRNRIRRESGAQSGGGLALAGLICGYVALGATLVIILVVVAAGGHKA